MTHGHPSALPLLSPLCASAFAFRSPSRAPAPRKSEERGCPYAKRTTSVGRLCFGCWILLMSKTAICVWCLISKRRQRQKKGQHLPKPKCLVAGCKGTQSKNHGSLVLKGTHNTNQQPFWCLIPANLSQGEAQTNTSRTTWGATLSEMILMASNDLPHREQLFCGWFNREPFNQL